MIIDRAMFLHVAPSAVLNDFRYRTKGMEVDYHVRMQVSCLN